MNEKENKQGSECEINNDVLEEEKNNNLKIKKNENFISNSKNNNLKKEEEEIIKENKNKEKETNNENNEKEAVIKEYLHDPTIQKEFNFINIKKNNYGINTGNKLQGSLVFCNKINLINGGSNRSNIKTLKDKTIKYEANKWSHLSNYKSNISNSSSTSNEKMHLRKSNTILNSNININLNKYSSIRDQVFPDKVPGGFVFPDLAKMVNPKMSAGNYGTNNSNKSYESTNLNLVSFKPKAFIDNNKRIRFFGLPKSSSSDKIKINNNLNNNNDTPSTCDFTNSTKKIGTSSCKNLTEDLSKFRMGLLSAGSTSNNNIIIPILPMRRPVSNFNFGGGQLWNNLDAKNNNMNNLAGGMVMNNGNGNQNLGGNGSRNGNEINNLNNISGGNLNLNNNLNTFSMNLNMNKFLLQNKLKLKQKPSTGGERPGQNSYSNLNENNIINDSSNYNTININPLFHYNLPNKNLNNPRNRNKLKDSLSLNEENTQKNLEQNKKNCSHKNIFRSQDCRQKIIGQINNEGNINSFCVGANINMEKLIPKLHKIKIEKGMMNSKFVDSLNKKIMNEFGNQNNNNNNSEINGLGNLSPIKKGQLPLMFNGNSKFKNFRMNLPVNNNN